MSQGGPNNTAGGGGGTVISVQTANASVQFSGTSTETLDFQSNSNFNLLLGSAATSPSGTGNTGIGYEALNDVTSGAGNTALGLNALGFCTTGMDNIGIGSKALAELTEGNENIAIGVQAGNGLVGGASNILIGPNAGASYTSTESNNIIIGGGTRVSGENATIRIGQQGTQTTAFIAGISGQTLSTGTIQIPAVNTSTQQIATFEGIDNADMEYFQGQPYWAGPRIRAAIYDDCFSGNNWASQTQNGATTGQQDLDAAHPGSLQIQLNSAANGKASFSYGSQTGGISFLGGGIIVLQMEFNIQTLSTGADAYNFQIGYCDGSVFSGTGNGCWFNYNANSSLNWVLSGSGGIAQDSGIAVTTGWHYLKITINAAQTQAIYQIDGNAPIPVSINSSGSTANITVNVARTASSGANPIFYLDYADYRNYLTTQR